MTRAEDEANHTTSRVVGAVGASSECCFPGVMITRVMFSSQTKRATSRMEFLFMEHDALSTRMARADRD